MKKAWWQRSAVASWCTDFLGFFSASENHSVELRIQETSSCWQAKIWSLRYHCLIPSDLTNLAERVLTQLELADISLPQYTADTDTDTVWIPSRHSVGPWEWCDQQQSERNITNEVFVLLQGSCDRLSRKADVETKGKMMISSSWKYHQNREINVRELRQRQTKSPICAPNAVSTQLVPPNEKKRMGCSFYSPQAL